MRAILHSKLFVAFGVMVLSTWLIGLFVYQQIEISLQNAVPAPTEVIAGAMAGIVLVAVFMSWYLSAIIDKSLHKVTKAAEDFAQKDLVEFSAAMTSLAQGDLTVRVKSQFKPIDQASLPEFSSLVAGLNNVIRESGEIAQKFNSVTDEPCRRLVYVGADSFLEGKTCAETMGQLLHGEGKVAIITSVSSQAVDIRYSSFQAHLYENYPRIQIVAIEIGQNAAENSYELTRDVLKRFPDLSAIYVPEGGGVSYVARALTEAERAKTVKLICHDLVDETMQMLEKGVVTVTIGQDPFAQGYDPVIHLYNYLTSGVYPGKSRMITQMDIITIENYQQFWDPQRGIIESDVTNERRVKPVSQIPSRELRIVFLGREDVSFFDPIKQGAQMAAVELQGRNAKVEWILPNLVKTSHEFGVKGYGPAIDLLIAQKVDALVVPIYDKNLVPYINRAVEAGVMVAVYNSEPGSLRNLMGTLTNQAKQLWDLSRDMTQSAHTSKDRADQINQAVGLMTNALESEAQSAIQAIENVQQIALAISNISQGAQEQAQAANSVMLASERISQAVVSNRRSAETSAITAAEAMNVAKQGNEIITQTLSQIVHIRKAVGASVECTRDLSMLSARIGTIVSTIDEIAAQTNLLALNAAMEAARAGEHGKGFAVVAGEVRVLAKQAAAATNEITGLIGDVQRNTREIVRSVDTAMTQAQLGGQLATQAGESLTMLVEAAVTMKNQTQTWVSANEEVANTLGVLAGAIESVSEVIEENVSATREVTNSVQNTVQMVNSVTDISKENAAAIQEVHRWTNGVVESSQKVGENASSVAALAEELQGAISTFKINN